MAQTSRFFTKQCDNDFKYLLLFKNIREMKVGRFEIVSDVAYGPASSLFSMP